MHHMMRHFPFLDVLELDRLFLVEPEPFSRGTDKDLLAVALGATLYIPADRSRLAADIDRCAQRGALSVVVCLEDSVADRDVGPARDNAIRQLREFAASGTDGPLIFVRVRAPGQIDELVAGLGEHSSVLSGFVLPKFTEANGKEYLETIAAASLRSGQNLYAMPVLESPEIVFAEARLAALLAVRRLLDDHRDRVLALRIGATDMSSAFGLRRGPELTAYDVRVVADAISDIVNVFGRQPEGYVITGPVWEYFSRNERMFRPQLRLSPFVEHDERRLRATLIAHDLDGLIREVALDRANGLSGKTVIHPSHVAAVNALAVVTHEEFQDASDILNTHGAGGVSASTYRNKMNESKPHAAWAHRTLLRARAFGVAREEISFVDLLAAGLRV